MKGFIAVYFREILIMKTRFIKMVLSMLVAPVLYVIAFGYGIGKHLEVNGYSYLQFLIPGLIAMNSMTQSYNIAQEINISRFYWKLFDEYMSSPISNFAYVLGEVLTGITRALLGASLIIIIGLIAGVKVNYSIYFWSAIILNAFVFSSIAVFAAMVVKSHADQAMLSNFIIFPMAFLGGTFFPVKNLPFWAQIIIKSLPITFATKAIRGSSLYHKVSITPYIALLITGIAFFIIALYSVKKAKD